MLKPVSELPSPPPPECPTVVYSFRFLERVVYEVQGVEPIAWKLDPGVREVALNTGWLPFSGGAAAAAARAEENTL